jgi:N6-L-threonylcarbamoyladenine synthase
VERLAAAGRDRFDFPRPMRHDGFDFSFSGLKTAVLYAVRASPDIESDKADLAHSFQAAVFDVLTDKVVAALDHTGYRTIVLGGGVACSRTLARRMSERVKPHARVAVAQPRLNADNAAMIARAGWFRLERGPASDHYLDAHANLPLPGLEPAAPAPATRRAR